jgi:hypothetical protein
LTETQFDRTPFDRKPFDRKFIRPNRRLTERRLTERRLTESSFYRKVIKPIFFRKWSFDRIFFRQKMSFDRQQRRHLGNQTLFWSDADLKIRKTFPILKMN